MKSEMKTDYIPYKKDSRGRWETVARIKFGHLDYPPFLKHKPIVGDPIGPAVLLLNELLAPNASPEQKPRAAGGWRNWDNVFDGLIAGDYDVVATPLFATFDRSKKVRFTAPLFFSNIGLYVRKEIAAPPLKDLKFDKLAEVIQKSKLDFLSVEGEISQKLAVKYARPERILPPYPPTTVLSSLFEQVANPENETSALFCESYFAEHQALVQDEKVVNVLSTHEILYPVCFAVRIGDYQLANLLNIRMLNFAEERGILKFLSDKLAVDEDNVVKADKINLHFVSKWPCP
jgi:hypothetical protein